MKPLGRKCVKFPSKTDGHFKKYGLLNWWEVIAEPNKKAERQNVKMNLKNYSGAT